MNEPKHSTAKRSTLAQLDIVAPPDRDVLATHPSASLASGGATVSQGIAMGPGWIALHRRLLDSPLWQKLCANHKAVMITMLLLANFKPSEFGCRRCKKRIKVGEGEMVYGAERIAELAGVTTKVARAAIANLISDGFLRSQSKERCHSHYIIVKWQLYQDELLGKQERRAQDRHQHGNQHGDLDGVHSEEGNQATKKQTTTARADKRPGKPATLALDLPPSDNGERWAAVEALRKTLVAVDPGHTCAAPKWRGKHAWKRVLDTAIEGGASLDRIRAAIDRWPSDGWLAGKVDGVRKINGMGDLLRHVDRLGAAPVATQEPRRYGESAEVARANAIRDERDNRELRERRERKEAEERAKREVQA